MNGNRAATRLAAAAASALALAAGGVAFGGCGSDNEGPAEEAGKAIDTGAKEATQAIKKGAHAVDKNVDVDVDTGKDAKNGGGHKGGGKKK